MESKTTTASGIDHRNQSVVIDGKPTHRGSWKSEPSDYVTFPNRMPDCQVVYHGLLRGLKKSGNGPCLGTRTGPNKEYQWMTYQEVIDKVHQFGSGLVHKGFQPASGLFVGIFAQNCPEWCIADYGSQAYSMTPVAIYETYGLEACAYIIDQCEIQVIVTDSVDKAEKLLKLKSTGIPSVNTIVLTGDLTDDLKAEAAKLNVEFVLFKDILELGAKNLTEPVPQKPSDPFSICYTSGTTGNPKGAMLSNTAFLKMADSMFYHMEPQVTVEPTDIHMSYLPLAHNIDRACHLMMFLRGAMIGYFSKDIKLLGEDMVALKPTFFVSVPRMLNRIYDAVQSQVQGSKIKSKLFSWALSSKLKDVKRQIYRKNTFWDRLIFRKVQEKLGGRVRVMICGSAPLADEVLEFFRCALGCHVLEGYGQTENGTGMTFMLPDDPDTDGVGPPIPGFQVKLVDVPEMDYLAENNFGEVCAKSECVFQGYYKQPDKTAEALDADGWLHTGDIGTWLPNGSLKIIDRKKNIFKLSQGEYIAPERIENIYRRSPFLAQCYIHGNSFKPCIMAVIVPDADYIAQWGPNNGFPATVKEFCEHKDAANVVLQDILKCGKKADLKGFEQVKDIVLEPEPFTIENELLTPTMKLKRPAMKKLYTSKIDDLYTKHNL